MAKMKSLLSFPDVKAYMDRALESSRGLKVEFESPADAHKFVSRANQFRVLDRKKNAAIYDVAHSMHGGSIYDLLYIRHVNRGTVVRIEKLHELNLVTEEL